MTKDVQDAIEILGDLAADIHHQVHVPGCSCLKAERILERAIRHLAYPDRDVYPKTRRASKGAPIVRK